MIHDTYMQKAHIDKRNTKAKMYNKDIMIQFHKH